MLEEDMPQMVVFGIYTNTEKDRDLALTKKLISLLEDRGAGYILCDSLKKAFHADDGRNVSECDIMMVIGGDGTMLGVARRYAYTGVKLFGINLGSLGFLLDTEKENLKVAIDGLINGEYVLEERLMIEASVVDGEGNKRYGSCALNEVAVSRKDVLRIINVQVCVNGYPAEKLNCDGVIVSTPTGSTGYSLSAGGPIMMPSLDVLAITSICSHSLLTGNLVISADDEVRIIPSVQSAVMSVDGQDFFDINCSDSVIVTKAPYKARFVRFTNRSFFALLKDKLAEWSTM